MHVLLTALFSVGICIENWLSKGTLDPSPPGAYSAAAARWHLQRPPLASMLLGQIGLAAQPAIRDRMQHVGVYLLALIEHIAQA